VMPFALELDRESPFRRTTKPRDWDPLQVIRCFVYMGLIAG